MAHLPFESLQVWQRGCEFCIAVCRLMRASRDHAFRDQMVRAALSIPSNIAEGSERGSDAEMVRFLQIARGSCGELRTQLLIAQRLGVIEAKQAEDLVQESREISAMIAGLVATVSKRVQRRGRPPFSQT